MSESRRATGRALRTPLAALALGALAASASAGPSTSLTVTGLVTTPTPYKLAGLQALPSVTQTDTFQAGTTPQTHAYTGASLWNVVSAAGVRVGTNKNDILNDYVLATGADGYKVVYSMGELNPGFGNSGALAAYAETVHGATGPLTTDGFARSTAPGDVKGGRYVSNLQNLDVRASGSSVAGVGGGPSTQFTVGGAVDHSLSFDLARLQGLPSTTETVGGVVYTGVSLWTLLNSALVGIPQDPAVKNDILGKYVVATGSDGYKALFSMGEIDPAFGDAPDIVAYEADGKPLDSNGFARIVVPDDVKAGRYVSNLISLQVFSASAVPEPMPAALLLGGLAILGLARRTDRAPRAHGASAAVPRDA